MGAMKEPTERKLGAGTLNNARARKIAGYEIALDAPKHSVTDITPAPQDTREPNSHARSDARSIPSSLDIPLRDVESPKQGFSMLEMFCNQVILQKACKRRRLSCSEKKNGLAWRLKEADVMDADEIATLPRQFEEDGAPSGSHATHQ